MNLSSLSSSIVDQRLHGVLIQWRVRRLSPSEVARVGLLGASLLRCLTPAEPDGQQPTPEEAADAVGSAERVAMAAVVAISDDGGQSWTQVQLVPPESEDTEKNRLSVGTLDSVTLGLIVAVALQGAREGAELVRPFRGYLTRDAAPAR